MFVSKGGISRDIDSKKIQEYTSKGYSVSVYAEENKPPEKKQPVQKTKPAKTKE